jgi:hypothetical protein
MHTQFWSENRKEKGLFENPGIDGRIVSKWSINK